ncbi:MAG TPA: PhzF family phenazine biosynthesis protein [bacterium]|nr:PhzF family phenazine biosynthesis protein [bacterium]
MDAYRYVICDVFTDTALTGNPLAVFTDARGIPEARLQQLARELNLSESVFVYPPAAGGDARIRIFTPAHELPFAGHPVLGTAIVLGEARSREGIRLETGRGPVPVQLTRVPGRPTFGWMSQPVPSVAPLADAPTLLAALGVAGSVLPVEVYDNGIRHAYVALETEDEVARLTPDMSVLRRRFGDNGVNCFAGGGSRWKTRMFAPGHGVVEDPATGSAAGPLAVHLLRHGRLASGEEIRITQGVEIGRPSTLHARVTASGGGVERVEVGGAAVIVGGGEFALF